MDTRTAAERFGLPARADPPRIERPELPRVTQLEGVVAAVADAAAGHWAFTLADGSRW